jgi:3-hydroxybutyrate dehydrogenase
VLTRTAAHEVGDAGIRINCVCPGATRTPMMMTVDESIQRMLYAPQAIKRMIEPDEIARSVVFLASDYAAAVTGSALMAELGSTAAIAPHT